MFASSLVITSSIGSTPPVALRYELENGEWMMEDRENWRMENRRSRIAPQPSIFYPQSSILNLLSSIFYPQSSILNLPSSIFHPQSSILNLPSSIFYPQSSILNLLSSIFHPQSSILNLPSSIFHPQSSILNLPSSTVTSCRRGTQSSRVH